MRSGVRERSRAAVAVAGQRERGRPSASAQAWTTKGKRPKGPFRPGKTAAKRGGTR